MNFVSACKNSYLSYLALILPVFIYQFGNTANAQIVPDETLPSNTVVLPSNNILEIRNGTTAGDNLFHSFSQFSLSAEDTALFNNAPNIKNIIGRVTGNSISDINGLIKANGTANLFLINPAGIVFGENAALDIGGSFIVSTADSIQFANSEFSAINPQASPLLTVNMPIGLQYGSEAGNITVKGNGHNAFFDNDFTFTVDRFERNRSLLQGNGGLEVAPGKSLTLLGKNILLDGGNLTAKAGNIELGSVAEAGTVNIDSDRVGFSFNYAELARGQVDLSNQASLDVSGNGSGNVLIYGNKVNLTDGSAIFAETEGDIAGGLISIDANEIKIAGTDPNLSLPSSIWSDVYLDATGDGGSVLIATGNLRLEDGGQINVNTFSLGDAGDLTVRANDIKVISESDGGDFISGLFAQADVFLTGKGGGISVKTENLLVSDGGQINTTTFGEGDAGSLIIEAENIELIGDSQFRPGGLFAATQGGGNGGNLTVQTNSLLISDGAQINNTTSNNGDAGTLSITATEIELTGTSEFGISGLFTNTLGKGKGGNLTVQTDSLLVSSGAQIGNTTFDDGDAGTLSITAKDIQLTGASQFSNSGLFASSEGKGNGGNLTVQTDSLFIDRDAGIINGAFDHGDAGTLNIAAKDIVINSGAQIVSSTFGLGNAGTLNITARDVQLLGEGVAASGIFGAALESTGNGGDINLDTDRLSIRDGASISVGNFFSRRDGEPGKGKGGNINVKANFVEIDNEISDFASSITASTNDGGGGNINLDVAGDIILNNNSEVSADTRGVGEGGNINLVSDRFSINNQARISVDSTGSGNAGNINLYANDFETNQGLITATSINSGGGDISLKTDLIDLRNNSEISTSVFDGTGGGGNIDIISNYILGRNNSDIRANAVAGDGGNINIASDVVLLDFDSEVDASSELGLDGAIAISTLETDKQIAVEAISPEIIDSAALITSVCPEKDRESLATTGKGGLAENPTQNIRGESIWEDLRDIDDSEDNSAIVEAKAWNINSQGKLELLSYIPQPERHDQTLFNQCG